jgi:hypothetical protein
VDECDGVLLSNAAVCVARDAQVEQCTPMGFTHNAFDYDTTIHTTIPPPLTTPLNVMPPVSCIIIP